MSSEKTNRTIRTSAVGIVLVNVVMVVMLGALIPAVIASRDEASAARSGNDLSACRAQLSAELVGSATDRADLARNRGVALVLESNAAILEGLVAVARNDDAALSYVTARASGLVPASQDATEQVLEATKALTDAREAYAALTKRAVKDPVDLLERCSR